MGVNNFFAIWVSDEKTGLAYSLQSFSNISEMVIFDSINLAFVNNNVSSSPNFPVESDFDYAQVLLPSGQILYIGGSIGIEGDKKSMSNLLTYDIKRNTWQMMV